MKKQTKSKKAGSSRKAEKPTAAKAPRTKERDPRLPAAGTTLTRTYKGKELKVAVLEDGFRFEGEEYRSLSALASHITGAASINGVLWFGLTGRNAATPSEPAAPADTKPTKKARKPRAVAQRDPPAPKCESGTGCTNPAEFGVPIGGGSTLLCGACVDAAEDVTRADCVALDA